MKLYKHTFTVIGKTTFPVDMLRYDRCFPGTGSDASLIEIMVDSASYHPIRENPVDIGIKCYWDKDWKPTIDRWNSFGWRVKDHKKEKVD